MQKEIYFFTDAESYMAPCQFAPGTWGTPLFSRMENRGIKAGVGKKKDLSWFIFMPTILDLSKLEEANERTGDISFVGVGKSTGRRFQVSEETVLDVLSKQSQRLPHAADFTQGIEGNTPQPTQALKQEPARPAPARSGETLDIILAELMNKDPNLSYASALRKAQELRPDLAHALAQNLKNNRAIDLCPWER